MDVVSSELVTRGDVFLVALDRFLVQLGHVRDGHRFLLTIDEFELLEEQIDEGRLDSHLLASFRAMFQTYPWLIMALAGLHRLEELRHDYWHPLFGSVSAIEVSFLSDAAARTLITSPAPDSRLLLTRPYNIRKHPTRGHLRTGPCSFYYHGLFFIAIGIKQHDVILPV